MADVNTLTVALAALGVGAGAMKVAQMALRRKQNGTPLISGQLSPEVWEMKIAKIVKENSNERIMPLLEELKTIAREQIKLQTDQNGILREIVGEMHWRSRGPGPAE